MKKKVAKKLDFSSERKKKSKQLRYFLISFAVFIIVLGTVSLLMFMKSLDFDLNNLGRSQEKPTVESTETTTAPVNMTGKSNIVLICTGADNSVSFSCMINTDMASKTIAVHSLESTALVDSNNITASLNEHFIKFGVNGFIHAVESLAGFTVDRYIKVNETQFKAFSNKCGDVVVSIPQAVNSIESGGLHLDAGEQSLSGDLLVKYLKYCDNNQKTETFSAFIKSVLRVSNAKLLDTLFSYLANHSETNISIVDYTQSKEQLNVFIENNGTVNTYSSFDELSVDTDEKKN